MASRNVEFQTGHYYHIYNRGNNRQLIFFERENYLFFLRKLREYLVNNAVEVVAYCLMPNHYHLLVYLNSDNLSNLMQAFILSYTRECRHELNLEGDNGIIVFKIRSVYEPRSIA